MIKITLADEQIGQVVNSQGSNQYFFNIGNDCNIFPIKNNGFDFSELESILTTLEVGDSVEIFNQLIPESRYMPPQTFQLNCSNQNLDIKLIDGKYVVAACESGKTAVSIIINDEGVHEIPLDIEYPRIPGLPQHWFYDEEVNGLPIRLSLLNPSHFRNERTDRLASPPRHLWSMDSFTPFVNVAENGVKMAEIPVVFRNLSRLFTEPEWGRVDRWNFVSHRPHIFFTESKIQLLPELKNPQMAWFDSNDELRSDMSLQLPKEEIFYLMIKDENDKWYPVKHYQEPCCVSVEVREWDLVKILEEHIDICEIQSESYIFKRLIINSKILDHIPYQYSLSDFEITVENPRGFSVEKNISNCELWIDVFCKATEGFETTIAVSLPSSNDTLEVPIYFDEDYDFEKTLFDELQIEIFAEKDNLFAVHLTNIPLEHPLDDYIRVELLNGEKRICELNLHNFGLKSFETPVSFESSKFQIKTLWHPFDNNFKFEKEVTLTKVNRNWLKPHIQHKSLNFHPTLQKRIEERINSDRLSECSSIVSHLCVVESDFQIPDVENSSLVPVLFYFTPKKIGIGRFHDFPEDDWGQAASLGFDEDRFPTRVDQKNTRNFSESIRNKGFNFNTKGIFIFAFCSSERARYFGPNDDNCEIGNMYDYFIEVEVI